MKRVAVLVAVVVALLVSGCTSEPEVTDASRCAELASLADALPAVPSDEQVQQLADNVKRIGAGLADYVARVQWTGAVVGSAESATESGGIVRSSNLQRLDRAIAAGVRVCGNL